MDIYTCLNIWVVMNIVISLSIALLYLMMDKKVNFSFVNPKVIYKRVKVNWFGAWFIAITITILIPAVAIPYWIYKICTVGRK